MSHVIVTRSKVFSFSNNLLTSSFAARSTRNHLDNNFEWDKSSSVDKYQLKFANINFYSLHTASANKATPALS